MIPSGLNQTKGRVFERGILPLNLRMNVVRTDYARLDLWSHTDLAYLQHDPALTPFLSYSPQASAIPDVLEERKKYPTHRKLLAQTVARQYSQVGLPPPVSEDLLSRETTYTVTTAHQPALLTGPLYHIYKIASTIHLAREIQKANQDLTIVPVFVIGGEDHDWAEINHVHLFGRRYQWEREASGPCGRLTLEGLGDLLDTVGALFSNTRYGTEIQNLLGSALGQATTYAQFHHILIHHLFGQEGLVVLNMDDPELKRAFIPVMERELREQFSNRLVPATQTLLEKAGFKIQAFCRPINLFYMTPGIRERLDPIDEGILRVESKTVVPLDLVIEDLHQHPERFSPNVILRPLYQETILPNLAYIGGGGEIAYWLERKSQFEYAGVHHPLLIRRNSLLLLEDSTIAQMTKAGLTNDDILMETDALIKSYVVRHSQGDTDYQKELQHIQDAYTSLAEKSRLIDPTLVSAIQAEGIKQVKQFEQLGSRLLRAEKQAQETNIKRVQKIKEKLFPENGLQERHDNFLPFYAQYGQGWIQDMISVCDPLDERFTLVELQAQ